jgi:hypothetical protein
MTNAVFWDVAPWCSFWFNRRLGGTYRLHLQGRKIHERGTSVSRCLKMEAIRSSDTSVQSTRSTRRHIPEDGILHSHKIVELTNNRLSCSVHGPSLHFVHLNNVLANGKYSEVSNYCFNPSYSSWLSSSMQLHAAMLPTFVASVIKFWQSLILYCQRVSADKYIMESEDTVEYRCTEYCVVCRSIQMKVKVATKYLQQGSLERGCSFVCGSSINYWL